MLTLNFTIKKRSLFKEKALNKTSPRKDKKEAILSKKKTT